MIKYFGGFGFAQTFLDNLSFKKFQLETDEKKYFRQLVFYFYFDCFSSIFFWKFSSVARFGTSFQHFLKYVFRLLQLVLIPKDLNSHSISLHYWWSDSDFQSYLIHFQLESISSSPTKAIRQMTPTRQPLRKREIKAHRQIM